MVNRTEEVSFVDLLEKAIIPEDEQPYKLPENWCWTNIGTIVNFERGITFPASAKENLKTDTNIPCIRTANIQENLELEDLIYINRKFIKNNKKKFLKKDDILMSSANSRELVGKTSYVYTDLNDFTFGGFVLAIRPIKVLSKFIYYYLKFEFMCGNFMGKSTQTTNIANINTTTLGEYKLPLPPLEEQHRIVELIEELISKIDTANDIIHECLDRLEERRMAIFDRAFTGKLTKQWRKSQRSINNVLDEVQNFYKDNKKVLKMIQECQATNTIIEEIADALWIKCNIGSVAEVTNGSTPSRSNNEYWNGSIPWISSGEVNNSHIWETKEKITEKGYKNSSVKLLPIGTVLIAMIGEGKTRGQSAILEIEATTNQNIAAIQIPHGLVSSEFLWYWLQYQYKKNREKGAGSGPQALNCQRVRELEIIIPPYEEQLEIVRILSNVMSIDKQSREILSMKEEFDSLKKSILSKAFRGELLTTDLFEPSSIGLLKEVMVN